MGRPADAGARTRILDAATTLARAGQDLTVAAVADRAGVSRSTVYRRFADRDALGHALAQERCLSEAELAGDDTRGRILDAAVEVFTRLGLAATTVERIADEAQVSAATVYRYFGDKAGLLRAFAEERSPRRLARSLLLQGRRDVAADLEALAAAGLRFVYRHRDLLRLALAPDAETEALLAQMHQVTGTTRESLAVYLERHLPPGPGRCEDPREMAAAFFGMIFAFAFLRPVVERESPGDFDELSRFIVRRFLAADAVSPWRGSPAL